MGLGILEGRHPNRRALILEFFRYAVVCISQVVQVRLESQALRVQCIPKRPKVGKIMAQNL